MQETTIQCGDRAVCEQNPNLLMTVISKPNTYRGQRLVMCMLPSLTKYGKELHTFKMFDVNTLRKIARP